MAAAEKVKAPTNAIVAQRAKAEGVALQRPI